jgi:predicted methyltransferase/ribosomal protein S18 acetylase RimI-like enzyme
MDVDVIAAEVASAVGLAEGPAGVRDVLRVIAHHEPVPTREVGRLAELPVPIAAAICNELRKRGVVDRARPVRLTAAGRAGMAEAAGGGPTGQARLSGECPACGGRGVAIPPEAGRLVAELELLAAAAPGAKLDLDQTHCTADSKLRRVLRMHEAGALAGQRVILLGDDDLISLAIAAFAALPAAAARPARLVVLDCDPDLLRYLAGQAAVSGLPVELIEHDLRQPLPAGLPGGFDVACSDPPYTAAGAELFLSRAVSALAAGGGRHVFFSFGARRPQETLGIQRLIAELGLTVRSLVPGFNSYTGAGILAGTSNLYHLRSTSQTGPVITGPYAGPLYTADARATATRPYRCAGCGAVHEVGPGAQWATIAQLKAAGCPDCRGTVLRPMPLGSARAPGGGAAGRARGTQRAATTGGAHAVDGGTAPAAAGAGYQIRPATEADLDTIAGFEIEIARVSFGDEAIEDRLLHRKRVAAALGRPGEVTLVAVAAGAGADATPVGWAWLSGRSNSLTGARYGNFRSLATADLPGRSDIAELLMRAVLAACEEAGFQHLAGKVHTSNLGMRALYRKHGFGATHLSMERRLPGEPA